MAILSSAAESVKAPSEAAIMLVRLREAIQAKIIGQAGLVEHLLVGMVSGGHMLIEGMPGLAKTTAVKALADAIHADFRRVQFTPDLLPSDITGTEIFTQETGKFTFREGPLFNNIILADEINRAPAKVQSALLEAMEERQITVGLKSYPLPPLFTVLATQNPVEQEGTYALPEAQLDRFMLHITVDYPTKDEELCIAELVCGGTLQATLTENIATPQDIIAARIEATSVFMHDRLKDYIVTLVCATREPKPFDVDLVKWLAYGVSPRATLALIRASKALAFIRGDTYVTPEHVQAIAPAVLRHRLALTFAAEAEGITHEAAVLRLLDVVAAP